MEREVVERLLELMEIAGIELEDVVVQLRRGDVVAEDVAACLRRAVWQLGAGVDIAEGTRQVWPRGGDRQTELEEARRRRAALKDEAGR
jgi:hypothetical protein